VSALLVGGGRPTPAPSGLPDAGLAVGWALPLAKLGTDLAAVATVGLMLTAAVLLPSTKQILSAGAARAARLAAWSAIGWAVAALAVLVLTLADIAGIPLSDALAPDQLWSFVTKLPEGQAWAATAGLAVVTAVVARSADRPLGAWSGLVLAGATIVPAALSGHSAAAGDHDIATSALVVHVLAVVTWVGGLAGLAWYARSDGRYLPLAAGRYSALALWAYVAVGVSGVANAMIRLETPANLWSSGYGALVLVKTAAFAGLGVVGWWHRRATLPQLADGKPGGFRRLATGELLVMAGVIGVAVALSRTPTPEPLVPTVPTAAESVLGFPLPGPPTLPDYLFDWRPDAAIALALLLSAVLYARGVLVLRRRGIHWPVGRMIGWYAGLTVAAFATMSGLATYGKILFSAHMAQHMLLGMLAPMLLVMGAPITLALRAIPPAGANRPAGPREWLLAVLHSRVVRVLTNPVVALLLFVTAPYLVYFSGLFETAMRHHTAHVAMHVHFLLVGYLFYETLIGTDPLPRRAPYPMRLIVLFASLPFHAFFAVALLSTDSVIAASYYALLGRTWGPDALTDQTTGSAFTWAFAEVPAVIMLVVLLVQWSRDDSRRARQLDRQADRDGDADLASYNDSLSRLNRARPLP
jgi:putative copper resistance protein D